MHIFAMCFVSVLINLILFLTANLTNFLFSLHIFTILLLHSLTQFLCAENMRTRLSPQVRILSLFSTVEYLKCFSVVWKTENVN